MVQARRPARVTRGHPSRHFATAPSGPWSRRQLEGACAPSQPCIKCLKCSKTAFSAKATATYAVEAEKMWRVMCDWEAAHIVELGPAKIEDAEGTSVGADACGYPLVTP